MIGLRNLLTLLIAVAAVCASGDSGTRMEKWPLLENVLTEVRIRGLVEDRSAIERAVAEDLIRRVDRRSEIVSDSVRDEHLGYRAGVRKCAGLLIESGDEYPVIREVLRPDPEGLRSGDLLLGVDDESVAESDMFHIYGLLAGEPDTPIDLVVSNATEAGTATVSVERVAVEMPALTGIETLPGGIGYVRLRGLYADFDSAAESIGDALREDGAIGTILDMRGATGDSIAAAARLAGFWLPATTNLFAYQSLESGDTRTYGSAGSNSASAPLIVLQDEETAGAAELFCAICSAAEAGIVLVGAPSRGDMLLRDFSSLGEDRNLYLLARKLKLANGTELDGKRGVAPDIEVDSETDIDLSVGMGSERYYDRKEAEGEDLNRSLAERIGSDAALRRAVDILIGIRALGLN